MATLQQALTNATAAAVANPTTPVAAAAVAAVVTLVNAVATFARYHTRGTVAMCSYRVAGVAGIVFAHCRMFAGGTPPATLQFTAHTAGAAVPTGSTLLAYRGAVAGGKLGRSSYSAAGIPGTFTVCNTLLPVPVPQALLVNATLVATPTAAGKVTSAVVAAGNVAQAAKAATAVATPAQVALVAGGVTKAIVNATPAAPVATHVKATGSTAPGKTAAQRAAHGKAAN
jgi:hypothetical protein